MNATETPAAPAGPGPQGRASADFPGALHVVQNAGSGRRDAAELRAHVEALCRSAGRACHFRTVERGGSIEQATHEAIDAARRDGGIVVAAGGDGTLSTVADLVVRSGLPMGILPQGTFNYFGRALHISADTGQAVAALLNGRVRAMQLGCVNDRHFLVNASIGLYPKLLGEREQAKKRFGRHRLVALYSAVASLMRPHPVLHWELVADGTDPAAAVQQGSGSGPVARVPLSALTLFVGNNPLQFEQLGVPGARQVGAGVLMALALRPVGRWHLALLLLRGAVRRVGESPDVVSFPLREITVRPMRGRPGRRTRLAVDGERVPLQWPMTFRVAPQPLYLVVPDDAGPDGAGQDGAGPGGAVPDGAAPGSVGPGGAGPGGVAPAGTPPDGTGTAR